jgi:hypothetical protein
MKEDVTQFLCDPVRTGAYCARLVIPYAQILELWNFLDSKAKEKHRKLQVEKPRNDRGYFRFMRDAGYASFTDEELDDLLNFLVKLKDICPSEVKNWAGYGNVVIYPEYFQKKELPSREGVFFFPPQIYNENSNDALSISSDNLAQPDFVADLASLKPEAIVKFKSFIFSVPSFQSNVYFKEKGKKHSQRYVQNLYPAVAALWVDVMACQFINRETIDMLGGVLDYIDKKEWRMSIILSAIATETILAEIYEEIFHKDAPPAPIGTLIKEINDRKNFPADAMKMLRTINGLRKASVHRSTISLSRRDAIVALMNSTKFAIWFSSNGESFCGFKTEA